MICYRWFAVFQTFFFFPGNQTARIATSTASVRGYSGANQSIYSNSCRASKRGKEAADQHQSAYRTPFSGTESFQKHHGEIA